jgi:2-polyprenyl-6-methoxyphenol hydroxylase-like FAD-dependent oxidoreductase
MRLERIVIVGGGIGGLAAGAALRLAGFKRVEVYERAPALGQAGAALSLWCNAVRVLDKMGLGDAVKGAGRVISGDTGIRHANGQWLARLDAAAVNKRYGYPSAAIRRADLVDLLADSLGRERIRLGATLMSVEESGEEIRAKFADGWVATGELLIAADGLNSLLRQKLHPNSTPRFAGYLAWRGIASAEIPGASEWTGEVLGRGVRFGQFWLGPGKGTYWFATRNAAESSPEHPAGRQAEVLEAIRGFAAPAEAIVRATEPQSILRHDVYDIAPLSKWGRGRMTLLGDAAHACTPNLGQGACQAIEDAWALAKCLKDAPDLAAGLRDYERQRIPRGALVIKKSRAYGRMAQWSFPPLCAIRDTLIRVSAGKRMLQEMDLFLGHKV